MNERKKESRNHVCMYVRMYVCMNAVKYVESHRTQASMRIEERSLHRLQTSLRPELVRRG